MYFVIVASIVAMILTEDIDIPAYGVYFDKSTDIYLSHTYWTLVIDYDVINYGNHLKAIQQDIDSLKKLHTEIKESALKTPNVLWHNDMQLRSIQRRQDEGKNIMALFNNMESLLQLTKQDRER